MRNGSAADRVGEMDRELVINAQAGDNGAFAILAERSLGRLNGVAGLILRDRDAADDAVQEALVQAWRSIRSLRDPDRFDPWLHRLLVRACYDRARGERRRRVVEIKVAPATESETTDAQRAVAIRDQLERGLGKLGPDQRAALVLIYYLDLPLAEAAQILDIPTGTLKSRLHRSLDALRAVVDADEREQAHGRESLA